MVQVPITVETRYNEILGTGTICLLYQIFCYISSHQTIQNKGINSLGPAHFVCYTRYFVISVVNKQYKTKEINSLGPEKLVCYIRYFVISDFFISSFHCITDLGTHMSLGRVLQSRDKNWV